MSITINTSNAMIREEEFDALWPQVQTADEQLKKGTGLGNDYLGWLDYPERYDREEFSRIQEAANFIRSKCQAFIVIGIGGSYLGAKAMLDAMLPFFANERNQGQQSLGVSRKRGATW